MVPVPSAKVRAALSWVLGLLATGAVAVLITHVVRRNRPLATSPASVVQPPAHAADDGGRQGVPVPLRARAVERSAGVREIHRRLA